MLSGRSRRRCSVAALTPQPKTTRRSCSAIVELAATNVRSYLDASLYDAVVAIEAEDREVLP